MPSEGAVLLHMALIHILYHIYSTELPRVERINSYEEYSFYPKLILDINPITFCLILLFFLYCNYVKNIGCKYKSMYVYNSFAVFCMSLMYHGPFKSNHSSCFCKIKKIKILAMRLFCSSRNQYFVERNMLNLNDEIKSIWSQSFLKAGNLCLFYQLFSKEIQI